VNCNYFIPKAVGQQAYRSIGNIHMRLTTGGAQVTVKRSIVNLSTKLTTSLTLTLWNWALVERPPVVYPFDSFPAFYGTRRFITALTRALHLSLSWARPAQSHHPILSLKDQS
jgi:hypothetical protein